MRNEPLGMRLRHGLLACAGAALIALMALASAVSVHAQAQAEEEEDTFEQKIIKNILGGLGVDVGRPGIDYRERSPLVIPPTLDLPPPESGDISSRNAAWPREPQRRAAAASNRPNVRATTEDPGTNSVLTPDEMRRGTNPRAGRVTDPSKSGSIDDSSIGRPLRPGELGTSNIFTWSNLFGHRAEQGTFTGEPTRGALTQPPPGYQTPSPSHPYGVGEERSGGWKIPSILDRPVGND